MTLHPLRYPPLSIFAALAPAVLLAVLLAAPCSAPAQDDAVQAASFLRGIDAYNAGDYPAAAQAFEAVAEAGTASGQLFYNLGNAYLKQGDVGRAVLWYERARRLLPADPDLAFNLELAREQMQDKATTGPGALTRVLFFWQHVLPQPTLQWLALAANALFWLALGASALLRPQQTGVARSIKALAASGLIFALLLTPTAAYQLYDQALRPRGIVLAEEVAVRSGRGDGATELFTLHAGTTVRLEARKNGWVRLRLEGDKTGWAPAETVTAI